MNILAIDSGIATSDALNVTRKLKGTTFRLIGEEADIAAMTDIIIQQPSETWVTDYAGGWIKRTHDGTDVVLNANNREQTAYGTGRVRFSKTADEQVGVEWDK